MTLKDEMLRAYKDSGAQKRIDQVVAGFVEQVISKMVPPEFLQQVDMTPPPPAPPKPSSAPTAYAIVGVLPSDPPELIDAVYRAKAKYLHPDSPSGNADAFMTLKTAYDSIRRPS